MTIQTTDILDDYIPTFTVSDFAAVAARTRLPVTVRAELLGDLVVVTCDVAGGRAEYLVRPDGTLPAPSEKARWRRAAGYRGCSAEVLLTGEDEP